MIQFELPKKSGSIIKVIGVGGGGGNAVNYMYNLGMNGVDFIVANTDQKALDSSAVPNKIQIGPLLTQGLGAGADPSIGHRACEESLDEIANFLLDNTKMVFVTAGMGGGTGTGGAPLIAKTAKDLGILTVGIVTTPFSHEGRKRKLQAEEGINKMRQSVDTLLVISNDKLRHQFGNLGYTEAFSKADDILATAAKCITDVINFRGHVVVDFADVSTVMKDGGVAILGSAEAAGNNRAQVAVEKALNSPLLNDEDISGARWVLINITSASGQYEHTLDEMDVIQSFVQNAAGDNCDVILGIGTDEALADKIGITIIATGFDANNLQSSYDAEAKPADNRIIHSLNNVNAAPTANTPEPTNNVEPTIAEQNIIATTTEPIIHQLQVPTTTQEPTIDAENTNLEIDSTNIENTAPEQTIDAVIKEDNTMLTTSLPEHLQPRLSEPAPPAIPNVISRAFRPTTFTEVAPTPEPIVVADIKPIVEPIAEQISQPIVLHVLDVDNQAIENELAEQQQIAQATTDTPQREIVGNMEYEYRNGNRVCIRIGQHWFSEAEIAERQAAERTIEDRASKLRGSSFDVRGGIINDPVEDIPSYLRQNKNINYEAPSTNEISNYSIDSKTNEVDSKGVFLYKNKKTD
jgi:cell division protein FtsZ